MLLLLYRKRSVTGTPSLMTFCAKWPARAETKNFGETT
jgi:hypothetical protein